ncbi:hypothetical protein Tco_0938730 [Tanacetum coccineum]|uniref:Uncharacterized protein n=1 Tax=Tanacetum coccineum TaxID=301880 RepID=A0ABQ5DI06_9ASTR
MGTSKKRVTKDSYNALQAKYDELQSEFGGQDLPLVAHKFLVASSKHLWKAIDCGMSSTVKARGTCVSLYVYGKHGPQPQSPNPTVSNASSIVFSICPSNDSDGELGAVSNDSSTHYSTCQSNDSDGEQGNSYKSNKYAVKGKMGTAVKTSAGCVWRKAIPLSNTNSGPTPNSNVTVSRGPQGRPKPVKAWVPKRN